MIKKPCIRFGKGLVVLCMIIVVIVVIGIIIGHPRPEERYSEILCKDIGANVSEIEKSIFWDSFRVMCDNNEIITISRYQWITCKEKKKYEERACIQTNQWNDCVEYAPRKSQRYLECTEGNKNNLGFNYWHKYIRIDLE